MSIEQDLQRDVLPAPIELWTLTSPDGATSFRFAPALHNGSNPSFGGSIYQVLPMQTTGWDATTEGASPQPSISFSNVTKYLQSYMTQHNNFTRWTVRRFTTFEPYLDGGATPDGNQVFNVGVALVEQKSKHTKQEVAFKLTMIIDAPNAMLPAQQVLRNEFPGVGLTRK